MITIITKVPLYSRAERRARLREKICRAIAYRLPIEVRKWVIVPRHAEVTRGNQHPDTVKAFDLYLD
jgi:hypothetical protein